jgi:hypothetical protein
MPGKLPVLPATLEPPKRRLRAYVADTSIGRDLAPNEAIKVICVRNPTNRVGKAESRR